VSAAVKRQSWVVVGAVAVSFFFILKGYAIPLSRVINDTRSFIEFRVPYITARDLLRGQNPYNYLAPPSQRRTVDPELGIDRNGSGYFPLIELLLYAPFVSLDFSAAKVAWLTFNFLLAWLSIILLLGLRRVQRNLENVAGMVLFVLAFVPLMRSLDNGQVNIVILCLLIAAMAALSRGQEILAGFLFSVASLIKPFLGIVFVGLLLRHRWKPFFAGLVSSVLLALISLLLFGFAVHLDFVHEVMEQVYAPAWWSNQSLPAFFQRIFATDPSFQEHVPWIYMPDTARMLSLLSTALLLAIGIFLTVRYKQVPVVFNLSFWLVTGFLVSPQSFDHYFPWLLIPLSFFFFEPDGYPEQKRPFIVMACYLMLAFPSVKWSSLRFVQHGPWLLVTGCQTYGLLLLYFLMAYRHIKNYGLLESSPLSGTASGAPFSGGPSG